MTVMDGPALQQLLLKLLTGTPEAETHLRDLSGKEWQQLGDMAEEHRLKPLLHVTWKDRGSAAIPDPVREEWSQVHRAWGITALAQRADLLATVNLLAKAAIDTVALKGAFLAWHAYPHAALRPLRDLDLLVGEAAALPAWNCLKAAGYQQLAEPEMALDDTIRLAKHLPALVAPGGSNVELHMRPWQARLPLGGSAPNPESLMANARRYGKDDVVRCPAPEDMLIHLALHGTLSGAPLDCGPLLLSDIDFLLAEHPIDWGPFWRRGEAEGWIRPVAYALALADRWRRPGMLEETRCPLPTPDDVLDPGPQLLLQSAKGIDTAMLASALSGSGKLKQAWLRLSGRRLGARRDFSADGGFLRWFLDRSKRISKAWPIPACAIAHETWRE